MSDYVNSSGNIVFGELFSASVKQGVDGDSCSRCRDNVCVSYFAVQVVGTSDHGTHRDSSVAG